MMLRIHHMRHSIESKQRLKNSLGEKMSTKSSGESKHRRGRKAEKHDKPKMGRVD